MRPGCRFVMAWGEGRCAPRTRRRWTWRHASTLCCATPACASADSSAPTSPPSWAKRDAADPAALAQAHATALAATGTLSGAIRIPHTVGPLHVTSDLRAGTTTCHVDIDAPKQGRPATGINWLVRQLRAAPDTVRVEVFTAHARGAGAVELLGAVRADPKRLVTDPKKDLRSFRVALTTKAGIKRGRGRGAYIDSVLDAVDQFYGDVLQHLKAWSAAPPRLREPAEPPPVSPQSLASTAQSSQDGAEPVPAPESGSPCAAGHDRCPCSRINPRTTGF